MDEAVMDEKVGDPEGRHPKACRDAEIGAGRGGRFAAVDDQSSRDDRVDHCKTIVQLKAPTRWFVVGAVCGPPWTMPERAMEDHRPELHEAGDETPGEPEVRLSPH